MISPRESIPVLIVEDEAIPREHLRRLVEKAGPYAVVAECSDVAEAVAAYHERHPRIVLVDVTLRGSNGFDFVQRLPRENRPVIIVVTADANHALRAFQNEAVDYLLKPFSAERLGVSLQRAVARLLPGGKENAPPAAARPNEFLTIKTDGTWTRLRLHEIDAVVAEDHVSCVQSGRNHYRVRETLSQMEARLPAETFHRVSRGTVVNIDQVRAIRLESHGDGVVEMRDGQRHAISRRYRRQLERSLLGRERGRLA